MDTRSYLIGLHEVLGELRLVEASPGPLDISTVLADYRRWLSALDGLSPPSHLAAAHRNIALVSAAMLAFLTDPAAQRRMESGVRDEGLEAAAEAGAAAFRHLQSEADELGLGLRFP